MKKFLKPIVEDLKALENGLRIHDDWFKFYVIKSIYDKPAKAEMLNMKSSTGYFGCSKCEIEGESVQYNNGHHIVFKHGIHILRNESNYQENLMNLEKGVLGECVLSKLRFYHPITSNQIDVMHSIFLGVCKLFFSYWFCSSLKSNYCLKNQLDILNDKLLSIKPPNFVSQAPRRLEDFKNWMAHEFLNFFLFFSIPLLSDVMKKVYFQNLLLFTSSLEILLNRTINKRELDKTERALNLFVSQLEELYDKDFMLSGTHEVLHLVQCTRELGPLKENLFPLEELNRNITRLIKGQNLVGDEFIKKWSVNRNLSLLVHNNQSKTSNKYFEFIKKNFSIRSSNLKRTNNTFLIRPERVLTKNISEIDSLLVNYIFKMWPSLALEKDIIFFERLKINDNIYCIFNEETRFCNSFVQFEENLGVIESIFTFASEIFLICRKFNFLKNPFKTQIGPDDFFSSCFSLYYVTNTFFHLKNEKLSYIIKLFAKKKDANTIYITSFNGSHLFN